MGAPGASLTLVLLSQSQANLFLRSRLSNTVSPTWLLPLSLPSYPFLSRHQPMRIDRAFFQLPLDFLPGTTSALPLTIGHWLESSAVATPSAQALDFLWNRPFLSSEKRNSYRQAKSIWQLVFLRRSKIEAISRQAGRQA
jgi:hypothetical protein